MRRKYMFDSCRVGPQQSACDRHSQPCTPALKESCPNLRRILAWQAFPPPILLHLIFLLQWFRTPARARVTVCAENPFADSRCARESSLESGQRYDAVSRLFSCGQLDVVQPEVVFVPFGTNVGSLLWCHPTTRRTMPAQHRYQSLVKIVEEAVILPRTKNRRTTLHKSV